jgi:thioesterase domain-containing protein
MAAQATYRPETYSGRLTLFRAAEVLAIYAHAGPSLGWDGLAADGVEVHEMPGGHANFVLEPHVQALINELKQCLARADTIRVLPTDRLAEFRTMERERTIGWA